MPRGVRGLRAERGAKGIHLAESKGECFGRQLTRYGQISLFAEKVFTGIYLAGRFGRQGGHPEHIAGAFAVVGRYNGRVDIDKSPLVKKVMNGKGTFTAHTKNGVIGIGSRSQMGNGSQIFKRMAFFLQRIIGRGRPLHLGALRLQLKGLFGLWGQHQLARDRKGGAYVG